MVKIVLLILLSSVLALSLASPFHINETQQEELPEYECAQAGTICSLFGVELTYESYRYVIKSDDPYDIQDIVFEVSTIPYFTAIDLCTTFENLFDIRAEDVGMEILDAAAFENCNSLTTLDLSSNSLKEIPSTVFTRPFPQFVKLANNQLSRIDKETFASLELDYLNLAGNNLNIFPLDAFKNAQFQGLFLQSNDLVDLDVDGLLQRFPKMAGGILIYSGNDIACSRVEEINAVLKRNNVDYLPLDVFHPYYPKIRYYEEDAVEGLPCIPDSSYAAMFYRKLFLQYGAYKVPQARKLTVNPKEPTDEVLEFEKDLNHDVADVLTLYAEYQNKQAKSESRMEKQQVA